MCYCCCWQELIKLCLPIKAAVLANRQLLNQDRLGNDSHNSNQPRRERCPASQGLQQ